MYAKNFLWGNETITCLFSVFFFIILDTKTLKSMEITPLKSEFKEKKTCLLSVFELLTKTQKMHANPIY